MIRGKKLWGKSKLTEWNRQPLYHLPVHAPVCASVCNGGLCGISASSFERHGWMEARVTLWFSVICELADCVHPRHGPLREGLIWSQVLVWRELQREQHPQESVLTMSSFKNRCAFCFSKEWGVHWCSTLRIKLYLWGLLCRRQISIN